MIEDDIRTYLLTQSPITALVSTDATGSPARIYANDRRQGVTADSITYQRISTDHKQHLDSAAGIATALIEFVCRSTTYAGAKTLAEALRGELHAYRGTMGSATIHNVILHDEGDDFEPPVDGGAKGEYSVIQIYSFQFVESVPTFA